MMPTIRPMRMGVSAVGYIIGSCSSQRRQRLVLAAFACRCVWCLR